MSKDCGGFTGREREREREREWFGRKLCKTVGIGNCRLSSRICFLVFLRSLTEPKITANARHYQIHLFHACTSASNQPSHSLLLMECLPFSPFFSDNNSAINRFKRDSSLRPGDSHPFDVGLGRAPPVDLPRICSYALAVEKRESIPMQSPRDGQALAQALKVNRTLKKLWLSANSIGDPGAEAPGWGGSPMGWMVKFVGKKGSVWEMFWARVSWCLPGEIFGTT